jgi:hypothetical protein
MVRSAHLHVSALALLGVALSCSDYRPARFADRAPVTVVFDNRPVMVPRRRVFVKELYHAQVYVRRELTKGLDPRRSPPALDVSSHDEVPTSSWFEQREAETALDDYLSDGPPEPPLSVEDEEPSSESEDVEVVVDARGKRYELLREVPERDGMRSGALVIASRLLHALGYRVAEAHVTFAHEGRRMAALRWPIGEDLGPTPIGEVRDDDPNDHLPHLQRRSLRSLTMFTGWLGMKRLRPRVLRDVYVGLPGQGHVQHLVVAVDGALGVDDYLDGVKRVHDPDRDDSNFFLRVLGMGLAPKPPAFLPVTRWPSVGLLTPEVLSEHYGPAPPFQPRDSMLPGDYHWAARRLSRLPRIVVREAVAAAQLPPEESEWLTTMLERRRRAVMTLGFEASTPCEVVRIDAPRAGRPGRLVIDDLAVQHRLVPVAASSYRVEYLTADGDDILDAIVVHPRSWRFALPLPPTLWREPYLVLRILGSRRGSELPHPFEVHIKPADDRAKLLGVRH